MEVASVVSMEVEDFPRGVPKLTLMWGIDSICDSGVCGTSAANPSGSSIALGLRAEGMAVCAKSPRHSPSKIGSGKSACRTVLRGHWRTCGLLTGEPGAAVTTGVRFGSAEAVVN